MNENKLLVKTPIAVRWRDLDAFRHVNNANYFTYLEEARLVWAAQFTGPWFSESFIPVVAAAQFNYQRPIEWPANIMIELYCERIGNSSVTIAHRIVAESHAERLYCDGQVTLVWIDLASGKSIALPDAVRAACQ